MLRWAYQEKEKHFRSWEGIFSLFLSQVLASVIGLNSLEPAPLWFAGVCPREKCNLKHQSDERYRLQGKRRKLNSALCFQSARYQEKLFCKHHAMPPRAVWGFCPQAVHTGSQVDSANAAESHTLSVPQVLLTMDSESHYILMKNLVQAVGMRAT